MLIGSLFDLTDTRFELKNVRDKLAEKICPNALGVNAAVTMCGSDIDSCKIDLSVRFFNQSAAYLLNVAVRHAYTVNCCKNGNTPSA